MFFHQHKKKGDVRCFFILHCLRDSRSRRWPPTICRFPYAHAQRPSALVYIHPVYFLFVFLNFHQAKQNVFFRTFAFLFFQRAYRKRKKKIQNLFSTKQEPPLLPPKIKKKMRFYFLRYFGNPGSPRFVQQKFTNVIMTYLNYLVQCPLPILFCCCFPSFCR